MNTTGESSGGSCDYYRLPVTHPTEGEPFIVNCQDVIEHLGMDFNEGTLFKTLWRRCADRTLGKKKLGVSVLREAEKIEYYGERIATGARNEHS